MDTNIAEKVERYNEIGQVVRVTLRWRGKIYYLQMFFPGSKFPSRGEVETQVKKIYPDAVVMIHYASETQPNQPLIRVAEGTLKYGKYGNYIDGQKREKTKEEPMTRVDYTKLAATNELEGEQLDEVVPMIAPLMKKIKPFTDKVKGFVKKGVENRKKQIDNIDNNPVKGTSQMMQMNSQEPEGEVIKEEEKENPTFVQFMKRIDQLPEVTRQAIKNCGDDPAIAKAALEISGIDK